MNRYVSINEYQLLIVFQYRIKRHEKVEKRFPRYTSCNLRGSAGSRNSVENGRPNVMNNPSKLTHWAQVRGKVEIWAVCWKASKFIFSFFELFRSIPKSRKNLQQIQNWSESDAKGGARALLEDWRPTRGRFTAPHGGYPSATSLRSYFVLGRPRNLLFSMPTFA